MRTMIIGGGGFVGRYLAAQILDEGGQVCVTKLPQERFSLEGCAVFDLDLCDAQAVGRLLNQQKPEVIYHLAAQSSVALSWKKPVLTAQINICGTLNLLEAVRQMEQPPRLLLIGSAEEYGKPPAGVSLVGEAQPPCPMNPYAVTKLTQNHFGRLYAQAYGLDILMVRAFNHIGPGQAAQFAAGDFCAQTAAIERGQQPPVIRVGNLAARRDFTDVRDVVCAYTALARHGRRGETYNVGSGRAIPVQALLDEIIAQAAVPIAVETDPQKLRPVDVPEIRADIAKLQADTGWSPRIPLTQTIAEMLAQKREEA